ncbi:hypothetical protein C9374_007792 [Naegleria lovaniensis]|uniref:PARP catalytic domain-containing protein n=1 Tax=Naegleria lovaniensis TaxID=51637 RepID=A0AA88KLQ4_NAELO|nr:uncharacterized protein C9374_007792 [Naegleria lovaniensis]KAG2379154.1 hypothetical protein C9374_007792 [Naegleria lovaniensis]
MLDLDKFQAGLDAMEMGDSNTAIKEFRKYVTCTRIQGKKWQKGQRETLIASLRNIAILLMNQKNYVDAILELNAAINLEKLSPSKVDSKLLRAECLIELQDFGKAKLDLAEAVEIVTIGNVACDTNKMYYLMGLCLFKEGNSLHKAISSLNLALQSHSHAFDLHIYKLLGEIHIKLKDYEQAQTCFTKAIQIVEKNCTEHVLLLGCEFLTDLYLGRSHARKEMQEFEKALEDCEVLTKLISEGSNSKPLDMDANTLTLIQKQKEEILSQMDEDSTPTLKSGGAYSKSNTNATSSNGNSGSNANSNTTTSDPSPMIPVVEQTKSITTTTTETSSSSSTTTTMSSTTTSTSTSQTTTTIKETGLENKIRVLSLSPHTIPQYQDTDLKELQTLKESVQYKPTVLHLLSLYQSEIKKEVEFKQKNKNSSSSSTAIVHVQVDPVPSDRKYIYLTSSGSPAVPSTCSCIVDYGHYLALKSGKSIMNEFELQTPPEAIAKELKQVSKISASSSIEAKKNDLLELEKKYTQIMQEKQKLLADRAAVLTPEELASIEEEEGIRRPTPKSRDVTVDDDEWELEHKRKIIEQERKLVEKRLLEEKKHRNVRFYCRGELNYLQQWNTVFSSGDNKKPSNLEELRKYSLRPTNVFDLEGEQIHYRFCESQFHRMGASPAYASSYPTAYISEVEYVVNPNIMNRFNNCKKELAKKHGFLLESMKPLLLFHGTSETNMENILRTNFLIEKIGSTTDMGWYGKGFYFSEYPGLSMAYSRNQYLLICMVLIGKAFHMNQVETGRPLESGYDSHVSPDGCSEVIIFNPDQVIPLYKIKWEHAGTLTYK